MVVVDLCYLDFKYKNKNKMGKKLFDNYSLLHFAVGVVMYFWSVPLIVAFIASEIFEWAENTSIGMNFINNYITFWPGGKPYPDSMINRVGDTISLVVGWIVSYYVSN